ncbi:hypothetical protein EXIGLDRAFT_761285 [Exidia glandulosa HHB12029]|uniref:DUF3533 domain-containing protein n=1 Tax=Exidia glandulosa HHB12029 TaxID=1314781 RepID=A0A165NNS1_EXIGL|nr:hypothetical protein EXIGLDRAFT_761285 [Exidia glandulosa HHB12029]
MSSRRPSSTTRTSRDDEPNAITDQGELVREEDDAEAAKHEHRPFSHGWRDPAIAGARAAYMKAIAGGTLLTIVAILAILSIYWGAFWKLDDHLHNLHVVVADLDGGSIGQFVTQGLTSSNFTGSPKQLTFDVANRGQFASTQDVERYVLNEHVWAAVVVESGASQRLTAAATDASYNGSLALTVIIETARNENAVPVYIQPYLESSLRTLGAAFALQRARQLSGSDASAILGTAPQALTAPLGYTVRDLRPFDVPVAAAVDFVGLIYLLIISFLLTLLNYNARAASRLDTLLNLRSLILIRLIVPFAMYFAVSWFYSFISLAFQVPFSRWYGDGGFLIYWSMSFIAMCALGLAVEALVTILTPRFVPYFLILWIISNVSVAFYPLELLPGLFKYGHASPFYNVELAVRSLLFGTKSFLGLNFGVMVAWVAVSCVTIPLFSVLIRTRDRRAARRRIEEEKLER